jgi:hypothetical protein
LRLSFFRLEPDFVSREHKSCNAMFFLEVHLVATHRAQRPAVMVLAGLEANHIFCGIVEKDRYLLAFADDRTQKLKQWVVWLNGGLRGGQWSRDNTRGGRGRWWTTRRREQRSFDSRPESRKRNFP